MKRGDAEGHSVALTFFNDFEAHTVEAIAERIIPGGDGDSARRTPARILHRSRRCRLQHLPAESYRLGLRELEAFCRRKSGKSFVELSGEEQDEVVRRFLGPESAEAAAAHKSIGERPRFRPGTRGAAPGQGLSSDCSLWCVSTRSKGSSAIRSMAAIETRLAGGVGFPGVHWGYTAEQMKEGYDGRQLPIRTLDDLRRELKSPPDNAVFTSNGRV